MLPTREGGQDPYSRLKPGSVRPEGFADSIDEELDPSAAGTEVDVEVLALDEQLAELAQDAPVRPFMKLLAPHVLQGPIAPGTHDRIDDGRRVGVGDDRCCRGRRGRGREVRVRDAVPGRAALPASVEAVFDGLTTLAACPCHV